MSDEQTTADQESKVSGDPGAGTLSPTPDSGASLPAKATRGRKAPKAPPVPTGYYRGKAGGFNEIIEADSIETADSILQEYAGVSVDIIEPCDKPGAMVPVLRGSIVSEVVVDPETKDKRTVTRVVYERS